jgi:spore coat protein U-like protein
VTCTNAAPYAIGMDNGTNASSGQRRMAYNGAYLSYNLFVDSAHSYPWSTAASNSTCTTTGDCYLGTGNGTAQSVNIYGVVPAVGTAPAAGLYTDTVVMTITY